MKFGADIHGPKRMNPNEFGDYLTFHLEPSLGQKLCLSNTFVYDEIPAKLLTFPTASALVLKMLSMLS